jgi:hypothetical protein
MGKTKGGGLFDWIPGLTPASSSTPAPVTAPATAQAQAQAPAPAQAQAPELGTDGKQIAPRQKFLGLFGGKRRKAKKSSKKAKKTKSSKRKTAHKKK